MSASPLTAPHRLGAEPAGSRAGEEEDGPRPPVTNEGPASLAGLLTCTQVLVWSRFYRADRVVDVGSSTRLRHRACADEKNRPTTDDGVGQKSSTLLLIGRRGSRVSPGDG